MFLVDFLERNVFKKFFREKENGIGQKQIYTKKGRTLEKELVKIKEKLLCFLFLIELTHNSLFKMIIATMYSILYIYIFICIYNEVNDSSDIMEVRGELGLFCYYKVLILSVKQFSVI